MRSAYVQPYDYSCIEISIKKQKIRCFINGDLLLESPCVTGTKGENDTPCGTFHIYLIRNDFYILPSIYKNEKYVHHAFFFLPWDRGYGIHDATWRGETAECFKPDAYLTHGSLGCVIIPLDVSQKLFEVVYLGMPVIINEE